MSNDPSMKDPVNKTENPEIYISHESQSYGPVGPDELSALLEGETITAEDSAWAEGMADWVPVSEMLKKFISKDEKEDESLKESKPEVVKQPEPEVKKQPDPEIYISHDSQSFGPVGPDELKGLLAGGTILETDSAWEEGMTDWISVPDMIRKHTTTISKDDEQAVAKKGKEPKRKTFSDSIDVYKAEKKPIPKKLIVIGGIVVLLVALGALSFIFISEEESPRAVTAVAEESNSPEISNEEVMDIEELEESEEFEELVEEKADPVKQFASSEPFPEITYKKISVEEEPIEEKTTTEEIDYKKLIPSFKSKKTSNSPKPETKIELEGIDRVGSYQGDDGLKYFTFYVRGFEGKSYSELPFYLRGKLIEHGSKQVHSQGALTGSFYYTDSAPILNKKDPLKASNAAYAGKPYLSVFIMHDGEITVADQPE